MPLPDVLASEIDALRSIVRTADTISARYQGGNALGCLQHLRDYVEPDTQTDEALEAVANRCGALMDEITFRSTITRVGDPSLGDPRQMALAAMTILRNASLLLGPATGQTSSG
jgi:hypothetical protein